MLMLLGTGDDGKVDVIVVDLMLGWRSRAFVAQKPMDRMTGSGSCSRRASGGAVTSDEWPCAASWSEPQRCGKVVTGPLPSVAFRGRGPQAGGRPGPTAA